MSVNRISRSQDQDENLVLLRAKDKVYRSANWVFVLQLILAILLPVIAILSSYFFPETRSLFVLLTFASVVTDTLYFDPHQRNLLKTAAKITEKFDCNVLCLPWDTFVAGEMIEPEYIRRKAKTRWRTPDDRLKRWYGEIPQNIPLSVARIFCQRANLQYDKRFREVYRGILFWIFVVLVISITSWSVAQNFNVIDFALFVAPFVPLVNWLLREHRRHKDFGSTIDRLLSESVKLWNQAIAPGACGNSITLKSRELQTAIFLRRVSGPLVVPGLYRLLRSGLEDESQAAMQTFISDYRSPD